MFAEVMTSAARKGPPTAYKLFGVLYHHGMTASGGHYTLDVLHPNRDCTAPPVKPREAWLRLDDEAVSDVSSEEVFGGEKEGEGAGRCAYLLFYRKVVPARSVVR